jgi:hypothetical protein
MTPAPTRLQLQYRRLFADPGQDPDSTGSSGWLAQTAQTRAMTLGLARPADWSLLSRVWRGVQADLDWPAPAIAVDGADAIVLWFSLAEPVSLEQSTRLLKALCQRYLPELNPERWRLWPPASAEPGRSVPMIIPPRQVGEDRWSAFVAPDLAAVFADDPALDLPPGEDAQADLLSRLVSIRASACLEAMSVLGVIPGPEPVSLTGCDKALADGLREPPRAVAEPSVPFQDPRLFLLAVMNDANVSIEQRIQAARVLLETSTGHAAGPDAHLRAGVRAGGQDT